MFDARHGGPFFGPSSPLASIVAERDAALAKLERGLDPEMKDLRLPNGGIDMAVAGPMVERLGVGMTCWFWQSGAVNYVEMGLNARTEPFDRYCVTVQKYGPLSPHRLRQATEDCAGTAEAERDVGRELAGLTWTVPDVDAWGRCADDKGPRGIRDGLNRLFRRAVTAEERSRQLQNDTDRAGQDALAIEAENTRLRKAVEGLLPRKLWGELIPTTPDDERAQITVTFDAIRLGRAALATQPPKTKTPTGVEVLACRIAADKCWSADADGFALPEEIWRKAVPGAERRLATLATTAPAPDMNRHA
uniref:hypothetical protein n=1 Tax=Methylobacterium sp. TaxID=409 RepID=UPI0020C9B409|nr:hypothetical protein [Methylobacterium sp.]